MDKGAWWATVHGAAKSWILLKHLKAAEVEMKVFYGPPTETNFAGGLLTGSQSDCKAACEAFAEEVCRIAIEPCIM